MSALLNSAKRLESRLNSASEPPEPNPDPRTASLANHPDPLLIGGVAYQHSLIESTITHSLRFNADDKASGLADSANAESRELTLSIYLDDGDATAFASDFAIMEQCEKEDTQRAEALAAQRSENATLSAEILAIESAMDAAIAQAEAIAAESLAKAEAIAALETPLPPHVATAVALANAERLAAESPANALRRQPANADAVAQAEALAERIAHEQAESRKTHNHKTVDRIVELIRVKYEDEGSRNFAIGREVFVHAQWQRDTFVAGKYTSSDFNRLCDRIADDVRSVVPIKSIPVALWARCHVLRHLVSKEITIAKAEKLSMFEYQLISARAMTFDSAELVGTLNPGWLDFIKLVVTTRSKDGGRVTSDEFKSLADQTETKARDAKTAKLSPAEHAAKLAFDTSKASAKAKTDAVKSITSAINDNLKSGAITPNGALAILEETAKHHGKPLVSSTVGFNPAECTVADVDLCVAAMFAASKLAELERFIVKATRAVNNMRRQGKLEPFVNPELAVVAEPLAKAG